MSAVRKAKSLLKKIRNLSYLFQKSRIYREASWCDEIKLVSVPRQMIWLSLIRLDEKINSEITDNGEYNVNE